LLLESKVHNPLRSCFCAEIGVSEISPALATMFGTHGRREPDSLKDHQQPSIKLNVIYILKNFSICGCIRPASMEIPPNIIMAWENT